jgi:hypothetical protein
MPLRLEPCDCKWATRAIRGSSSLDLAGSDASRCAAPSRWFLVLGCGVHGFGALRVGPRTAGRRASPSLGANQLVVGLAWFVVAAVEERRPRRSSWTRIGHTEPLGAVQGRSRPDRGVFDSRRRP